MLEMTNLVTLSDDKEYVVTSKAEYEGKIYYYFVDINDNKNIKFLLEDGDELEEVDDDELVRKLLPLFLENVKQIVPEEVLDEAKNMVTPEMMEEILSQVKPEE